MKKFLALTSAAIMMLSLFASCGKEEITDETEQTSEEIILYDETDTSYPEETSTKETTTQATTVRAGDFDFTSEDFNGKTVKYSDFRDAKVIMINMWEPWCGPCVNEMPEIQKLYEKYKDEGFVVIGVCSQETGEDAKAVVEENGITYPIIYDSSDFDRFATGYVPTTVFVDGNGNILTDEPIIGGKSYEDWEVELNRWLKNS